VSLKRVVFTDEDPGCAAMAATLFDAMVHPELVHGSWAGGELSSEAGAQLRRTLSLAGVARPLPERAPSARADRVVVLTDAAPAVPAAEPATVVERWRLTRTPLRSESDFRRFHDLVRPRVWRMVAREGWYRLQPRTVKPAASRGARVVPLRPGKAAPRAPVEALICPACGAELSGKRARTLYVQGVRFGGAGALTTAELRCQACVESLPAAQRAQWLKLSDVSGE
jgi:hypothetical protein